MEILVTKDTIKINMEEEIHKGEYKINTCEFTFSEDYTQDLVKVAVFTRPDKTTYRVVIQNDECDIPYEVLNSKGAIVIGVYAYSEDNGELVLRYSPRPVLVAVQDGSYIENTEEGSIYVPASTIEEYEQQLQDLLADVEASKDEIIEEVTTAATTETVQNIDSYMDQFVKINPEPSEFINVKDSSNLPIKDIKIKGNSSGNVDGNVVVNCTGKNIINLTNLPDGKVAGMDFTHTASGFTIKGTANGTYKIMTPIENMIKYISGRTYTAKAIITGTYGNIQIQFDGRGEQGQDSSVRKLVFILNSVNSFQQTKTANFIEPVTYGYFVLEHFTAGQYYDFEVKLQVEESSTATDYEPYTGQTVTLPLEETQLAETDTIHNDNGTWKINDTAITDTALVIALNTLYTFHTYKNTTNFFSVTSGADPIIDVTYIQDLETRLNNIEARLSLLE